MARCFTTPTLQKRQGNTGVLLVWALLATHSAQAGLPTVDVANIVQTTKSAFENIEQTRSAVATEVNAVKQVVNSAQQIEHQVQQIRNMNGNYLKHMLLNDYQYRRARRQIPATYQRIKDLYNDSGVLAEKAGLSQATREHITDAMVSVGAGDAALARADGLITETEALIDNIEQDTELKAALDLANRMAAQNQLLGAELLRIQGLQLSSAGRQRLHAEVQRTADVSLTRFTGFRARAGE